MTTAATTLLGLALPVTGELSGTWGDTVNNSITSLLDTAVAGTTTLSTDADVTLTTTTLASNQARQAILLCSGARTALRTITAPAQSKIYTIINATTGGFSVKLVGVGPTTGLTIPNGASAVVAWNGSDFIEVGSATVGNLTVNGNLSVTGTTSLTGVATLTANPVLSAGTANGVAYLNGSKVVTTGSALTFDGTKLTISATSGELGLLTATGTSNYLSIKGDTGGTTIWNGIGTDTGVTWLGSVSNHPVSFRQNNSEGMRLTSTGLGIGTSSPSTRLTIGGYSSANQTPDIQITRSSSGTAIQTGPNITFGDGTTNNSTTLQVTQGRFGVWNYGAGVWNERMSIDSSGNLGIGTSSPYKKLEVVGSGIAVGTGASASNLGIEILGTQNSLPAAQIRGYIATGNSDIGTAGDLLIAPRTDVGANIRFITGTTPTERARIDSSGNLGIGTSSPLAKLDVQGGSIKVKGYTSPNYSDGYSLLSGVTGNIGYIQSYYGNGSAVVGAPLTFDASYFAWRNIDAGYAERMRLDSSGNLGLGVTPSAWQAGSAIQMANGQSYSSFGITNNAYYDGAAYRYITTAASTLYGNSSGSHLWFNAPSGTAGNAITFTQAMTLDASGNLGVGTTSPSSRFEAAAGTGAQDIARFRTGDATAANNAGGGFYANSSATAGSRYAYMWLDADGANFSGLDYFSIYKAGNSGGVEITNVSNSYMTFGTNNTERARIDASGNLLVGSTSTSGLITGQLQLGTTSSSTAGIQVLNSTTGVGGIYFGDSSSGNARFRGEVEYNHNADALVLSTAETERARIDNSGNLLIGRTTVPVTNTAGVGIQYNGLIIAESSQTQGGLWVNRITSDGNAVYFTRQNVLIGTISVTGSATAYNTSSDYRLKENIQPMTGALAKVAALKPVTYKWKADGSDGEGFIAHELAEVVPQCVTGEKDAVDEDGKPVYQGIDTSFLVATLTAALQEAVAEINQLKADVAALKGN